jgi:Na+-driven multidrug efflux pump
MALGNNEPDKARNIFTQSFLITLVIAGAVIALPSWFGANGIWLILPAAEALTALLLWIMNRRKSPLPEIG